MSLICIYLIFEEIMVWVSHSHFCCCQRAPIAKKGEGESRGVWGWRSWAEAAHGFLHGAPPMGPPPTPCSRPPVTDDGQAGFRTGWSRWVGARDPFVTGFVSKAENVPSGFAHHVCTGCHLRWNTHGNSETRGVPPGHPPPRRGEGRGSGHRDALPVPSRWKGKKDSVLNLVGFYNFHPNLGYAGDCREKKIISHQSKWKW